MFGIAHSLRTSVELARKITVLCSDRKVATNQTTLNQFLTRTKNNPEEKPVRNIDLHYVLNIRYLQSIETSYYSDSAEQYSTDCETNARHGIKQGNTTKFSPYSASLFSEDIMIMSCSNIRKAFERI